MEEDPENQKHGAVVIAWWMHSPPWHNLRFAEYHATMQEQWSELFEWLPVRISSLHLCIDSSLRMHDILEALARVVIAFVPSKGGHLRRVNVRLHDGE